MTFTDLCELGACDAALIWLGDRNVEDVWTECHRADWMLWLLEKLGYDVARLESQWSWHTFIRPPCVSIREFNQKFVVSHILPLFPTLPLPRSRLGPREASQDQQPQDQPASCPSEELHPASD